MNLRNEKGFAMISVALLSSILYGYSLAYFTTLVGETATIRAAENSLRAEAIAEAAAEEIMWEYNYGGADFSNADGWTTSGTTKTKTVGSFTDNGGTSIGTYSSTITGFGTASAEATVNSTFGTSGSARTATMKLATSSTSTFTRAITAKNLITINGSNSIDSYNSTVGAYGGANILANGDVATNSTASPAVIVNGANLVMGDIAAGAGATMTKNGPNSVTGTFTTGFSTNLPDNTVPSSISSLATTTAPTTTTTINAGSYKYSSWTLNGSKTITINGDVKIYVTGNFLTNGTINITVNTGSSLTLYAGGNVTFNGNPNLKMTNNVQTADKINIIGLPGCTNVSLNGSGVFVGAINAPNATYTYNGTNGHWGSVIASSATLNGTGDIHYDEALGSAAGGGYKLGWARRTA